MASGTALLVASAGYRDPKLRKLRAPAWDAQALGRVLADPAIGEFDVELALDEPESVLRRKIARFFADRHRDDLLLLHMSCHGLKDDDGNLYFATVDTEFDHLDSTAVSAEFVHRQMARSRSGRIVLLLDCCYSGAFSQGMAPRAGAGVELKERFAERGRAVISASNAMEYSFEGDDLSGEGKPAIFTSAVVKALETGQADRDGDGWISVDELYDYVYEEIRDTSPQRPVRWLDLEGDLRIAKSVYIPPVQPTELPADLRAATESPLRAARLGAVQELSELLAASDQGQAKTAHDALKALAGDDSQRVSAAAKTALLTAEEQARRESEAQRRREAEERAGRDSEAQEAELSERQERRAAREAEEQAEAERAQAGRERVEAERAEAERAKRGRTEGERIESERARVTPASLGANDRESDGASVEPPLAPGGAATRGRPAQARRPRRRSRLTIAAVAIAIVVCIVVGAVIIAGNGGGGRPNSPQSSGEPSQKLLGLIPLSIRPDCVTTKPPSGASAAAVCHDTAFYFLGYGLFPSPAGARNAIEAQALTPACDPSTRTAMKEILPRATTRCGDQVKVPDAVVGSGVVMLWNENGSPVAGEFAWSGSQDDALRHWEKVVTGSAPGPQ